MQKALILTFGILLTLALVWFSMSNYRAASPLAEESLRGIALSITAAVESAAASDHGLLSLANLRTRDLAFLSIVDRNGRIRFHSNPDLIGTKADDVRYGKMLGSGRSVDGRVLLRTGERAYEFLAPVHLPGGTTLLHLTLHTYRADAVVRRARLNISIILLLLIGGWAASLVIYRLSVREEKHQRRMAHQENMARLGEMGAVLAHEIRNPLGGIKGFAQVIEKRPVDERNSKFASRIVAETIRLENLVADLLSYAHNNRLKSERVNLCDVIEHSVSLLRPEANQHAIELSVSCGDSMYLLGRRDHLEQVLLNIIRNGIQSMHQGGVLAIETGRTGTTLVVTITDTGEGIREEDAERIFDPFFTTKAKGTGLGLPLCKKIIEEHEGSIEAKCSSGKGTSIIIKLPGLTE
ncbi:nitrogen regulation protein NR(II) [Geobacter sp. DSM 9736]|uniref:two-component system sensor histidine kinase NtrB n=1 Tax=Geobacter sp. DSM 9736 TaxID=1277350 RepID=UPI000B50A46D|nr:ATP-binding protein [Geobacter sp. DSM 9736]SNB45703.1 two-component system, NtrC family, sensor histidine kinase HydH [Geobacter sp. DSM 9736]